MVSRLERAIRREREALIAGDDAATERLLRAWLAGKRRLEARIARLEALLAEERTPARVMASARYAELLRQLDAELMDLGALLVADTVARQRELAEAAGESARRLVAAQAPGLAADFAVLPREAVQELVGVLGDGSPVAEAVGRRFGAFAAQAKDELAAGVIEGIGLRQVAERLLAMGDGFVARHVLTLARTEPMRAARSASLQTYAANADVLDGWVWLSALSPRTCLACLVMHGRRFPLSAEFFPSHPQCRCSPAPWVKGHDLDIGPTGEQWFRAQPAAAQRKQMGGAAWAAWRKGEVRFSDFLGERNDPTWGPGVYERSLREVLGERRERRAA